eukprot:CAMPEP_0194272442 /NCGR_PEP_ID=MMETSP0169-20130528/6015_1 /TAXON_ID=218684 /ORGANISM="Corethron pennatum, Strain L29A3" /LENGTH=205 /DNA_ID=CAMNT_0039015111 /DNA_START=78 /DNA_END=694 /DNA_ORIENTATION=+
MMRPTPSLYSPSTSQYFNDFDGGLRARTADPRTVPALDTAAGRGTSLRVVHDIDDHDVVLALLPRRNIRRLSSVQPPARLGLHEHPWHAAPRLLRQAEQPRLDHVALDRKRPNDPPVLSAWAPDGSAPANSLPRRRHKVVLAAYLYHSTLRRSSERYHARAPAAPPPSPPPVRSRATARSTAADRPARTAATRDRRNYSAAASAA